MSSFLRLNRMLVSRGSTALYDERFHAGVNIIHGSNGSGKSTIADFIFYGLGGDLRDWRKSAERAEEVILEITTPQGTLCLRRQPSADAMRPMGIFFGTMEAALGASADLWQTFPYKRPDRGYSFSQVLFRAIGLPESVSDGSSNITMHQALRLLYVDQLTPVQRVFRVESFDTWQTRQAVGDMLAGIGGYDLFDRQIALRETKKLYDEAAREYTSLVAVAAGYGEKILSEHIEIEITQLTSEREGLLASVTELTSDKEIDAEREELKRLRGEAFKELHQARKDVAKLEDEIEVLDYEVGDAEAFIAHLRQSLLDFQAAKITFIALGQLDFEFCPSCFAPVTEKSSDHCHLCDTPRKSGEDDSRTLAVQLDLQMQLKESEALQVERKLELDGRKADLRGARQRLRRATNAAELSGSGTVTGREAGIAELSRKIGFIDSQLEGLQRRHELARRIAAAAAKKEDLNARQTRLQEEIGAIERAQAVRKQVAYTLISNETKALLDMDLSEHSDFGDVSHVDFSFADDWIALNGEKYRARSASGMVILKNSFAAALLKASLVDARFNLPRWMLFDNIEDKGMVEERSRNFQRLLVAMSEATQVPHQIIFTTSMLAPELDRSDLIIGPKYTKEHKTLKE